MVAIGGSALMHAIDMVPSHGVESVVSLITTDDRKEEKEEEEASHGGHWTPSADDLFNGWVPLRVIDRALETL